LKAVPAQSNLVPGFRRKRLCKAARIRMPGDIIRAMLSRHSAFYTPLLVTVAGEFLKNEGLEGELITQRPKGKTARDLLMAGQLEVMQSSVITGLTSLEKGERDFPMHFAQINQRDGFFLVGRERDPAFQWGKLEGVSLLAEPSGQPLFMLKYCAHYNGVEWDRIKVMNAGDTRQMDQAFRSGRGDYVHQQGPQPQQLEKEQLGYAVVCVGEAMPPVSFSTVMASRAFLRTAPAKAFMRAFRRGREWAQNGSPAEIASSIAQFFPEYCGDVLTASIARYQRAGCWAGDAVVSPELYQQALEVFSYNGQITRAHAYEAVVAPPPDKT